MRNYLWSIKEIKLLKAYFPFSTKDKLKFYFPNRTLNSLSLKASELDISRKLQHKHNMRKLLEDTPEAFYWIGFLLADGYFVDNRQISLELSNKDESHIIKFNSFVNKKGYKITPKAENRFIHLTTTLSNSNVFPLISEKFGIQPLKTYNPPTKLQNIKDGKLLFSLIIGYIDGDGTIQKRGQFIKVDVHFSWLEIHKFMEDSIYKFLNLPNPYLSHINTKNLASLGFHKIEILNLIKKKAIELNLPIMRRKWDRINENRVKLKAGRPKKKVEIS